MAQRKRGATPHSIAFGARLRAAREAANMSQEDVAQALNVSTITVGRWEAGDYWPKLEEGIALAKLFNTKVEELVPKIPIE